MSQQSAIVDKLLTNVSRGLFNEKSQFIVDSILPVISSAQSSGKIGSYGKENLRITNTIMGGKGGARRINSNTTSSDSFYILPHGLSDIVTKEDKKNYEKPFEALADSTEQLWEMLMLGKEKSLADSLGSTTVMSKNTTLTGTDQWSDYNNSDPLGVAKDAAASIHDNAGRVQNKAVVDWKTCNTLEYHPQILENLGFSRARAGLMKPAELAFAFDVDELLVGSVKYNSADLGQTDTLANVWGDNMIFMYSPKVAKRKDQALGFQIVPTKDAFGVYKSALSNPPLATEIVHTMDYDIVLTDVNCAYLVYDCLA